MNRAATTARAADGGASIRASLRLDEQLCFALYSTSHAMTKLYRRLLRRLGLTYPQYLVMLILWERDAQTVSEIGERLFLDSATLTPLLKRLQSMELLTRERSAQDERQVVVSLTKSGRALQRTAASVPEAVFAATRCPVEELRAMRQGLELLRSNLLQSV
jgi:DNA-binding MarR family transcriptional regulator